MGLRSIFYVKKCIKIAMGNTNPSSQIYSIVNHQKFQFHFGPLPYSEKLQFLYKRTRNTECIATYTVSQPHFRWSFVSSPMELCFRRQWRIASAICTWTRIGYCDARLLSVLWPKAFGNYVGRKGEKKIGQKQSTLHYQGLDKFAAFVVAGYFLKWIGEKEIAFLYTWGWP